MVLDDPTTDAVSSMPQICRRPDAVPIAVARAESIADPIYGVSVRVDYGSARSPILALPAACARKDEDVDMGGSMQGTGMVGAFRTRIGIAATHDELASSSPSKDESAGLYASDYHIADLDALDAAFVCLAWKRMVGFRAIARNLKHSFSVRETGTPHHRACGDQTARV